MRNFRKTLDSQKTNKVGTKAVTCMLSVAMTALIFLGTALMGNTKTPEAMTVAEEIRAAGDRLSASVDTDKVYPEEDRPKIKITRKKKIKDRKSEQQKIDERDKYWLEDVNAEKKREIKMVEKVEIIPYEIEIRETPLISADKEIVIQEGENGESNKIYRQRIEGDEVVSNKLYAENDVKAAVNKVVLVGAKEQGTAISPLDFEVELDENGIPLEYSDVWTDQVATGYHLGSKAVGASGEKLSAGYVAVNPNEIPYGTKMYITSADGSFVYGFAIAADTGYGLMKDVIDVDLYYDTYEESCLNGKRNVNIYIL